MHEFDLNYHKLYKPFSNDLSRPRIAHFLKKILGQDKNFLYVVIIYSIVISLLGVAVPISVQLLINSVSFTALMQPVIVLGVILLALLIFSGSLHALQFYTTEIFQRRFMARMSAKICLQLINADPKSLNESNVPELINRFFDIATIQKTVPKFLIKTLSFVSQAVIGLVLVSFYHPFFLVFNIVVALCLYLIYALFFKKACMAAFFESRRKYDIAGGLEDFSHNINIFKSEIGQKYAKYKIDELTRRYLSDRKNHFKSLFSQTILLLLLYAFASALLLVLGGYLVLVGELTLGQLVAAELILAAILYSMSQFGHDFENMYDLIAACEKLTIFLNIPQEKRRQNKPKIEKFKDINFENVLVETQKDESFTFNLKIASGKKYLIHDRHQSIQHAIIDMLLDFNRPTIGEVRLDGQNIYSYDMINFRNYVHLIDYSPLIEGTLIENLTFNQQNKERGKINQILRDLGLEEFSSDLNLRVVPSGWPLNEQQTVMLKIARALLLDSKIIIVTEILDIIEYDLRQKILQYIAKNCSTLLYFSNHKDDNVKIFDQIIDV